MNLKQFYENAGLYCLLLACCVNMCTDEQVALQLQ